MILEIGNSHLQSEMVSLNNKIPHFQSITETWLNSGVFDVEILPLNYSLYKNQRESRSGGVLLAVHKSISSRLIDIPKDIEALAIHLQTLQFVLFMFPHQPASLIYNP